MLFFAGHSHTENHQGIIFINPQESLTINELKTALNQAIKQGLNLAIFNSCDGIGLAQELSKLNIPQVIVMREGVPDLIAQEFLKNFLCALQQNKSVFCALREARERLQAWDKDFPGGSWLPIIYQNLSIPNDSIFKISFDDNIQVSKNNKSNVKIFFYSISFLLILFFAVKNTNNYSLNKLSSIISNLLVNNLSKSENITFEEEAKILIENLYQALSNKDFAHAETFYDVSLKQQFNPNFFKQFSKVIVDKLEVTYQDMNIAIRNDS
ncbi:CHAT domain-containing protein [Geminocystis herdmanii]|uniref:CHAT domain-containing protein n=1 Tax=Geminocystis herdmanii TaxID=669359 RepID=UPI000344DFEE|nr:CHAT domain-containing protein [Geminocystis herdmanii]